MSHPTPSTDQPLVSIITPVYNGVKYLAEAAQSVIDQTYSNWEYVIVNNQSKDGTAELAEEIARRDPRIRVHHNAEFLKIMPNWNHALRQMSPQAKYCKMLCADDRLFPECVERMVAAAEAAPSAGIIGSYRLEGTDVAPQHTGHLPLQLSGRDVCRANLRQDYRMFCCPSGMMYRADMVREHRDFFDQRYLHADVTVCYQMLKDRDFAFCQQILMYVRMHEASVSSSVVDRLGTNELERVLMTREFGPTYLTEAEYPAVLRRVERHYYRELVGRIGTPTYKACMEHQKKTWATFGEPFSQRKFLHAMLRAAAGRVLNLRQLVKDLLKTDRKLPPASSPAQPASSGA